MELEVRVGFVRCRAEFSSGAGPINFVVFLLSQTLFEVLKFFENSSISSFDLFLNVLIPGLYGIAGTLPDKSQCLLANILTQ